jgi:hypothetical protein
LVTIIVVPAKQVVTAATSERYLSCAVPVLEVVINNPPPRTGTAVFNVGTPEVTPTLASSAIELNVLLVPVFASCDVPVNHTLVTALERSSWKEKPVVAAAELTAPINLIS